MSAKSSIQVCIKLRPCEHEQATLWQVKDNRAIQLVDSQTDPCVFDYVFDQQTKNQIVFDCMAKHIVEACIKGFNGTIFAYGQTSSGKTYTMMGDDRNPGVMVLAAQEIFKQIAKIKDRDFLLRVGFIEIYNEKIYDLLNKKNQDLKIHESNGMVNVNCEECIITSEDDLLKFLCMGNKERTVGETNMNERSSRSHAIFRIIIESRKADRLEDDAVKQSLLNLVDLAGSERADQTGARGARLKEGGHINKSLHFLSNVIKSLAENEDNKYVSFRDSKLTRILQASLGGNAFTSIICSIKPSIMEESQSTINFAMRAKKIRLKPQVNEIVSDATMMKRLEREIKELKDRLALEQRKNESQLKVKLLEERIRTDTLKIISSSTISDKRLKNRRRTWCPTSADPDVALKSETNGIETNGSVAQHKRSNLPKPSFYPSGAYLSQRGINAPKTLNIMKTVDVADEEEFKPAINHDFGEMPNDMMKSIVLPPLVLSPRMTQSEPKSMEFADNELAEFTNLEKYIETELILKKQLNEASVELNELRSECSSLTKRLEAQKEESDNKLKEYETQLKTLSESKEAAEAQVTALKATVKEMEMENRDAVDLHFEYENHKSISKRREKELLLVISERESTINSLEKSLNELSKDVLSNSRQEHIETVCPTIQENCELLCETCANLERLIRQQENNGKSGANSKAIECETEKLHAQIAFMRSQLETVQLGYKQITTGGTADKTELCDRLSHDVLTAVEDKSVLQDKNKVLELSQQSQEKVIETMQADYDRIQLKYLQLRKSYETLQQTSSATEEQYRIVQAKNDSLLAEISTLKESIEIMQGKLRESPTGSKEELVKQLKVHNEKLAGNVADMETKFTLLQREYDHLSNQLVESIQECDFLNDKCNKLLEEIQQKEAKAHELHIKGNQLNKHIVFLETEIARKTHLIQGTESNIEEMREQMRCLEAALLEKSVIVSNLTSDRRDMQERVNENSINESQMSRSTCETTPERNRSTLLRELEEKDNLITTLQYELRGLNERCIAMEVKQTERKLNTQLGEEQLRRQISKSIVDATRIDQLQALNAELTESSIKAKEAVEELKGQYEIQITELRYDLSCSQKEHSELKAELDSVKLEYLNKMEVSEAAYRDNIRRYNREWEDSKYDYEAKLASLNRKLTESEKRCKKLRADKATDKLTLKDSMSALITEKHELESLYDGSQKLVEKLQNELAEKNKYNFDASDLSTDELHIKYKKQIIEYEELKELHNINLEQLKTTKCSLQSAVEDGNKAVERLTADLQTEKAERDEQTKRAEQLKRDLDAIVGENAVLKSEHEKTLSTLKGLEEQLSEMQPKIVDFDKLVNEWEQCKVHLTFAIFTNKELNEKLSQVQDKLAQSSKDNKKLKDILAETEAIMAGQINHHEHKFKAIVKEKAERECDLDEQRKRNATLEAIIAEVKSQVQDRNLAYTELEDRLKTSITDFQNEKAELELMVTKRESELEARVRDLSTQLKNNVYTQGLLDEQRKVIASINATNAELQSELQEKSSSALEATVAKTNAQLATQVKMLQEELTNLRKAMVISEDERIGLDATIACLLDSKRDLEERLLTANESLQKANTSVESRGSPNKSLTSPNKSRGSPNKSPFTRRSLEREPQPRRSVVECELRRNRRISTHDERRQSYWNDFCDVACMTDPVDNICNCTELDKKVQTLQRDLFISECKVTALNIELKNHPLKEEYALLKNRLQQEQAKARDDVKRLKQKCQDLMSNGTSADVVTKIETVNSDNSTQTDSDLELELKKMADKLSDSLQLCRHRYNKIQSLEEKLKEFENMDDCNVSSQTAGQINALKCHLEKQKKENYILSQKYEKAKQVLKYRKDEVAELRKLTNTDESAPPK